MRLMAPSAASKSFSPWCVVSVGDTALLLSAMSRRASPGTGVSLGDDSAPADSRSGSWPALLASSRRWYVSFIKGSVRLDSMFQCSLEGGLRGITILGPCRML